MEMFLFYKYTSYKYSIHINFSKLYVYSNQIVILNMMYPLFLILTVGMIQAGNINIVVERNELECVFITKQKFEFLEATVRIDCYYILTA